MLLNLSPVMEFLGNVFTNFRFEKLLSHEALVTGRVTVTSNNQTQFFLVAINEKHCLAVLGPPLEHFYQVCNAITRQPIQLENCSNPLRIRQVF